MLGIAFGKKARAREAVKKEKRQAKRAEKKASRRQFKLDKIKTRQDSRTQRTSLRVMGRVAKEEAIQDANSIAYENGLEPQERGGVGATISNLVGGLASAFLGGGVQQPSDPGPIYDLPATDDGMGGMMQNRIFGIPVPVALGLGVLLFALSSSKGSRNGR